MSCMYRTKPSGTVLIPGQGSDQMYNIELVQDDDGRWWVNGTVMEDGGTYYMPVDAHYYPVSMNVPLNCLRNLDPAFDPWPRKAPPP